MKFNKWISGIKPDDSPHTAALRSLRLRLRAVQHFLGLAAHAADQDIEHVHLLRVWARRSLTALRLYRKFIPGRRAAWIEKRLKRILKTAGAARDCDVLLRRLDAHSLVDGQNLLLNDVVQQRMAAEGRIVALYQDLKANDRFQRRIEKFLSRIKQRNSGSGMSVRLENWAIKQTRRVVGKFFDAIPADKHDLEALHQFRISGKKLRYQMELLAFAFPVGFRKQLYPQIAELQQKLGEINDRVVTQARLHKWIVASHPKQKEKQHLRTLLAQDSAALEAELASLQEWFSTQRVHRLREAFAEYTGPS